jgi:hypothetical protein
MNKRRFGSRYALGAGGLLTLLGVLAALVTLGSAYCRAGWFDSWFFNHCKNPGCSACGGPGCVIEHQWIGEPGGTWYWLRSPEEERKAIIGLYNRYCIRCHGVDGRGVWDIPGVPDFTDPRFHACRSDGQLVRAILEGRGAVMPPFRGTLTLEEGWGMARYLRTFIPGTEKSRSDTDNDTDKEKGKDKDKDADKEKDKAKEKGKDKDKAPSGTILPPPVIKISEM